MSAGRVADVEFTEPVGAGRGEIIEVVYYGFQTP